MIRSAGFLLLSVIMFLKAFFPMPSGNSKLPNEPPTHLSDNLSLNIGVNYRSHYQKTVLVIIDALRWDFATAELMPLTIGLMNDKGCLTKVAVESPTVTLPRIKALTTGSVPQYIDVIKNLASSEILEDSWLHSARNRGLKTVFYGDNTWEKLFPDFFARSEGTTSFFVWDFVEVDDNVTRNVAVELERKDWDIMILHYLGLDHIGHVLGPFSSKIPPKLSEMDHIIHTIYEQTNYTDTIILITGDHGMRDAGGHGGTSQAEILVPLITIGHKCLNSTFQQTDIPANLAVLLGLNIPSTSIGNLQKSFLHGFSESQYLYALRYNTELLLMRDYSCMETFDDASYFHEQYLLSNQSVHARKAEQLYQECAEKITKKLFETSSKQDMPKLILVLLSLLNILLVLLLDLMQVVRDWELILYGGVIFLQFFSALSVYVILTVMGLIKIKGLIFCAWELIVELKTIHMFLLLTCILQPLTFVSTSFIEEEHYFWMHFSITLITLLLIERLSSLQYNLDSIKLAIILVLIRFSMDLNSTIENSVPKVDNWGQILAMEAHKGYHQAFFAFNLILVLFTISHSKSSHLYNIITLSLIFILKSLSYHNAALGKLIWTLIFLQKVIFQHSTWQGVWILMCTLLMKPHNVILIPFAAYTANQIHTMGFKNPLVLTVVANMLSQCFYFLQGHRNSLADIDVSIGYVGLGEHRLVIVILQLLIHTYTFPVLFHISLLKHAVDVEEQKLIWYVLLVLRASVILITGTIMLFFRHHLFVWSVFAPKLFIESVHTAFLFIEIFIWQLLIMYRFIINKIK